MTTLLRVGIVWLLLILPLAALEKVSLQLKWHHQFQFAGYYAALEKGFYREEGLEVTIKDRDVSKNNVAQVLSGESEYGIADSVLFAYQARKEPVVIVAPIFQHSPNVLMTLKSSGIDSPYKLAGKKIALYPLDTDGLALLAMLHETGVMEKGFKRLKTHFDVESFRKGEVDAHHGYLTNEPYALFQANVETNIINPQHYGVDLYGDILFTSQKELRSHPKRVAAMKRATIRGWQYALSHKEELINLIHTKYAPAKSREHLRYEAEGIEAVISPATIPIGTLDSGRFEYIQHLLYRHGLITSTVPFDDYLYRESRADSLQLTPKEREWLRQHPVIRTAIDTGWAPFEYLDEKGEYRGIAADYMALLSQKLGVKFEPYTRGVWKDAVAKMEKRELDMYPCAVRTAEREKYALFTTPYLNFRMVILTDREVDYLGGTGELGGKTIAVARGYLSEEILRRYYPHLTRLSVDTVEEGLEAVSSGRAFAFVDNTAAITHAIKKYGFSNLKISGELPHRSELSMGIRSDWPIFAGIVQKGLDSITPEERDAIYNRHVRVEYTRGFSWNRVIQFVVPLSLLIAILLYYSRRQKLLNRRLQKAIDAQKLSEKELREANEELRRLSSTDPLTGVANRLRLDEALHREFAAARRYRRALSVIMIDLDHFKEVNDTYGHHAGDRVLQHCAAVFRDHSRRSDTIGRWGGEEFLIICPETDETEAATLAEKLRTLISTDPITQGYRQTASFGVYGMREDENAEDLVRKADEALYEAKNGGRDRVVRYGAAASI